MSGVKPSKRRILVVEDDPSIATLVTRALSAEYEVTAVNEGGAALNAVASLRPDLVLLDVNLPGMDGFRIAESLKADEQLKRIPIVFVTARDRPTEVIRGIQVGARHYLTKPFKLEELLSKVKKALNG